MLCGDIGARPLVASTNGSPSNLAVFATFVICGVVGSFILFVIDPDFAFSQLASRDFWIPFLGGMAILAALGAILIPLHDYTFRALHWLGAKFVAAAPAPVAEAGRWLARGVRVIYGAAALCGVVAFGLNLWLWGVQAPRLAGPLLKNPLFWLTWLGVMAALIACGYAVAIVFHFVVTLGVRAHEQLWKKPGR